MACPVPTVPAIPLDGPREPFLESHLGTPTEQLGGALRVQAPARLAVGLRGVPADLAGEAAEPGDQRHQVLDGDFHARAQVDGCRLVHDFRGAHQAFGSIFHVEEFAARAARSPAGHVACAGLRGLDALADERGNHVRGGEVEVVPRPVEVHGQEIGGREPVLPAVTVEHHHGRLLGDAVRRVGLLGVAVPQPVLMEGHRRELRVRADGARLHELADAVETPELDQVQCHRHVGEEVAPRVRLVGADAADLGGKVDDEVGIRVAVEARHVRLVREVIVLAARDEDLAGTAGTEAFGDGAAEEAGAAGEEDAGGIEFHGSSASIIGFRAQRLDPEMFIVNSCRTPQVAGV